MVHAEASDIVAESAGVSDGAVVQLCIHHELEGTFSSQSFAGELGEDGVRPPTIKVE